MAENQPDNVGRLRAVHVDRKSSEVRAYQQTYASISAITAAVLSEK